MHDPYAFAEMNVFYLSLKNVPQVSKTQVWKNLMQLLEEATSEDDIHDVEFLVSL